ncbi:hypothetical protein ACLB2K_019927 [Fragaria x ananassa]
MVPSGGSPSRCRLLASSVVGVAERGSLVAVVMGGGGLGLSFWQKAVDLERDDRIWASRRRRMLLPSITSSTSVDEFSVSQDQGWSVGGRDLESMEERWRLGCSGGGDSSNNVAGKEAEMLMLWWAQVVGFLSLIWASCWAAQFPQNNRAWSKAPYTNFGFVKTRLEEAKTDVNELKRVLQYKDEQLSSSDAEVARLTPFKAKVERLQKVMADAEQQHVMALQAAKVQGKIEIQASEEYKRQLKVAKDHRSAEVI